MNLKRLRAACSVVLVPLLLVWCGLGVGSAAAAGLSGKEQKQVIAVVRSQLAALAQDDAEKAFSYAAPNIRQLLGNAQNFMTMVRTRYEVVYRPVSVTFMQPSGAARDAELEVRMTDGAGKAWVAIYTLQRQGNNTWRIAGCAIAEATGTMV